jgi:hypothetical protein
MLMASAPLVALMQPFDIAWEALEEIAPEREKASLVAVKRSFFFSSLFCAFTLGGAFLFVFCFGA